MMNRETDRSSVLRSVSEGLDRKADEILRAVHVLRQPGEVAEVRAFSGRGTNSGYFNDFRKLAECAAELDDRGCQVYMTLNPVVPTFLAHSENRLEAHPKATTTDADIGCTVRCKTGDCPPAPSSTPTLCYTAH